MKLLFAWCKTKWCVFFILPWEKLHVTAAAIFWRHIRPCQIVFSHSMMFSSLPWQCTLLQCTGIRPDPENRVCLAVPLCLWKEQQIKIMKKKAKIITNSDSILFHATYDVFPGPQNIRETSSSYGTNAKVQDQSATKLFSEFHRTVISFVSFKTVWWRPLWKPMTAEKTIKCIIEQTNPEFSLKAQMITLKLSYFGYIMVLVSNGYIMVSLCRF